MKWNILSIASKGQYNYARVPDHPNATKRGYVLEHRIVMENKIGRLLTKKEIVHHKDENKKNNISNNLKITDLSAHSKIHSKGRTNIKLKCFFCKIIFDRELKQVKNRKHSFCSRSCNAKNSRKNGWKLT